MHINVCAGKCERMSEQENSFGSSTGWKNILQFDDGTKKKELHKCNEKKTVSNTK